MFFCKQKTADEMRISDWSSDVCSSDLMFPDAVRHLGGEPLLHLQAAGKAVQHARQLGYADHPVARKIGDMRLADDRRQVMLAVRLEGNVLQKHDLVIAAHLAEGDRKSVV